jgi:hypothetical protein
MVCNNSVKLAPLMATFIQMASSSHPGFAVVAKPTGTVSVESLLAILALATENAMQGAAMVHGYSCTGLGTSIMKDGPELLGREVVLGQDLRLRATGGKKPEHGCRKHTRPGSHRLTEGTRGIRGNARATSVTGGVYLTSCSPSTSPGWPESVWRATVRETA